MYSIGIYSGTSQAAVIQQSTTTSLRLQSKQHRMKEKISLQQKKTTSLSLQKNLHRQNIPTKIFWVQLRTNIIRIASGYRDFNLFILMHANFTYRLQNSY